MSSRERHQSATAKLIAIWLSVVVLIFLFQNCSTPFSPKIENAAVSSHTGGGGGNGEGYDGKVYVHVVDAGLCSDGALFDAKIDTSSGKAILVRENCQDLAKDRQLEVSVVYDASTPHRLTYAGQVFVDLLPYFGTPAIDSNGGIFIAGRLTPTDGSQGSAFITKLSSSGVAIWSQKFAPSFFTGFNGLSTLSNGNVVAVGRTEVDGKVVALAICLRPNGQVAWQKAFLGATGKNPQFDAVFVGSGDKILVSGTSYGSSVATNDAFAAQLTADGALAWQVNVTDASMMTRLISITQAADGQIYVSGRFEPSNSTVAMQAWIAKLSSTGSAVWSYVTSDIQINALVPHADGGVAFAGYSSLNQALLARLSPNGAITWANQLNSSSAGTSSFVRLSTRTDGSMIATGTTVSAAQYGQVVSVAADGGLGWAFEYHRSDYAPFYSGHSMTPTGEILVSASLLNSDKSIMIGSLLKLADSPAQPSCAVCVPASGFSSTSTSLVMRAGPTLSTPTTGALTPAPVALELTNINVDFDYR